MLPVLIVFTKTQLNATKKKKKKSFLLKLIPLVYIPYENFHLVIVTNDPLSYPH